MKKVLKNGHMLQLPKVVCKGFRGIDIYNRQSISDIYEAQIVSRERLYPGYISW